MDPIIGATAWEAPAVDGNVGHPTKELGAGPAPKDLTALVKQVKDKLAEPKWSDDDVLEHCLNFFLDYHAE